MAIRPARTLGLLLVASGAAHFVKPQLFEPIAGALPGDTRQWVYRNGAAELAIGLALTNKKTRKLGVAGAVAFGGVLAAAAASSRR